MKRLFLAVFVAISFALIPAAVAGQEANATTTATATTTAPVETVAVEIDNRTRLTEWNYQNGTWEITFEADRPVMIVITDSARAMEAWEEADGKTAADLNPERYTLTTGKTRVTYPGTMYDGQAAITVATSDGMKFLATGGIQRSRPPVTWGQAQILIAVSGLGAAYVSYRRVRGKYEETDQEAERIA